MRAVLEEAGLSDSVELDSAGTIDFHTGKSPDARMRSAAKAHGYQFVGSARQVQREDLARFDLILAMDRANLHDLRALVDADDSETLEKLALFASFCRSAEFPDEVPDPYYGGEEGFHEVVRMVEDGCSGILEWVKARL